MREIRSVAQEATEDVFFGQIVIIWARWFLIVAGVTLALWVTPDESQLVVGIIPVVVLMAMNFYLHGRYLMERPANVALISAASVVDIAVITGVVLFWPDPGQRGLASQLFILYYPVVLAFAFVMPRRVTIAYTVVALLAYAGACLLIDPSFVSEVAYVKVLLMRLITLAAMGGLGTYYWRIQRDRRHAAVGDLRVVGDHPVVR